MSKNKHPWLDNVFGYTFGKPPMKNGQSNAYPDSLWDEELRNPGGRRDQDGYPQLPELLRCIQVLAPDFTEPMFSQAVYSHSVRRLSEAVVYSGGELRETVAYELFMPSEEDEGPARGILDVMASRGADSLGFSVQIENDFAHGKQAVSAWVDAIQLALVAGWWWDEPKLFTGLPTLDGLLQEAQTAIREARIGRPAVLELMRRRKLIQEFSRKYNRLNVVSIGADRNVESLLSIDSAGYVIDTLELEAIYRKSNRVRD